jgi:hypothetical protein
LTEAAKSRSLHGLLARHDFVHLELINKDWSMTLRNVRDAVQSKRVISVAGGAAAMVAGCGVAAYGIALYVMAVYLVAVCVLGMERAPW